MPQSADMSRSFGAYLTKFLEKEATQLLLIFAAVLYISILVIDRVKRRRKKCPPGPIGLPFLGSLPFLGEEPHKAMVELGKKYGNIFSLYMGTKYTVVLNDYDSMKEGLSHPAALDRAPNLFDHVHGGIGFEGLNGPPWQEQRRFCMQAMRDLGFGKGSWEVLIHEEIASLLEELESSKGKPIEVFPLVSTSISNNVVSLLIGRRLQKETESDIVKLFYDFASVSFKYMGPSDPASLVPGFRKFLQFFKIAGYHQVPAITKNANVFIKEEIERHKSSKESREIQNFINRYLDQLETTNDSKEKRSYAFSEKMLEGNMNILFLAGSDTIANSLCFMVRLMAAYPDIQKKIQDELDAVIGRDGTARYEERSRTPYTFASILEMERFATIVPLSTTRLAREDFELGGYTIPKGAEIFGNTWAVHNDLRYWKEPEKFRPERFLSEDGTKLLKLPSYVPFSIGKRNCPGETVAWMELYLYLSSIMQKFNISAPAGEEINFKIRNGLVVQLEPQNLHFTLRET